MIWTHIEAWWHAAIDGQGWLVLFGMAAQTMFMMRFVVQWISSERAGRSVMPTAFWWFSLGGGLLLTIYGVLKHELVIIVGQLPALIIYTRNLHLIRRESRNGAA
jgi:lipid-A-disaccharide synthase-like uncharacterized protein